jgi:hypothetical protein
MEPRNRFQGMNSASLCGLAERYDNHIPTRFLAPIDRLKIPALMSRLAESIPGPLTKFKNTVFEVRALSLRFLKIPCKFLSERINRSGTVPFKFPVYKYTVICHDIVRPCFGHIRIRSNLNSRS